MPCPTGLSRPLPRSAGSAASLEGNAPRGSTPSGREPRAGPITAGREGREAAGPARGEAPAVLTQVGQNAALARRPLCPPAAALSAAWRRRVRGAGTWRGERYAHESGGKTTLRSLCYVVVPRQDCTVWGRKGRASLHFSSTGHSRKHILGAVKNSGYPFRILLLRNKTLENKSRGPTGTACAFNAASLGSTRKGVGFYF